MWMLKEVYMCAKGTAMNSLPQKYPSWSLTSERVFPRGGDEQRPCQGASISSFTETMMVTSHLGTSAESCLHRKRRGGAAGEGGGRKRRKHLMGTDLRGLYMLCCLERPLTTLVAWVAFPHCLVFPLTTTGFSMTLSNTWCFSCLLLNCWEVRPQTQYLTQSRLEEKNKIKQQTLRTLA